MTARKTSDVFGISTSIKSDSYVDRGQLDSSLVRLLERDIHLALRGESKAGKSWLRQKIISNPIIVQCRHKSRLEDLYMQALSEIGISFVVEKTTDTTISGKMKGKGEMGWSFIAKAEAALEGGAERSWSESTNPAGKDVNDLRFIAEVIKKSGRRLVIEDFHYLSVAVRKKVAFDLKAFWEYHLYVIVIGIWSQGNMLLSLNPDLSGRLEEHRISWTKEDLRAVVEKGCFSLKIEFSQEIMNTLVNNSYGNVGILQALTLKTLDEMKIYETPNSAALLSDVVKCTDAIMLYAEQLEPLYLKFAKDVAAGIRRRRDSTGIYAHTMAVILQVDDESLYRGLEVDQIFEMAHVRQKRIQKSNLKSVLEKIEELQVDEDGRGLVFSYNPAAEVVTVIDKQILLFRKYQTISWPWDELIRQSEENNS
jgi:hypothetical protein